MKLSRARMMRWVRIAARAALVAMGAASLAGWWASRHGAWSAGMRRPVDYSMRFNSVTIARGAIYVEVGRRYFLTMTTNLGEAESWAARIDDIDEKAFSVTVGLLWPAVIGLGGGLVMLVPWRRRVRPGMCRCGYELRGLPEGARCPECGRGPE